MSTTCNVTARCLFNGLKCHSKTPPSRAPEGSRSVNKAGWLKRYNDSSRSLSSGAAGSVGGPGREGTRGADHCFWHFIPDAFFQQSSVAELLNAAPLLEEKRNPMADTLIPNLNDPILLHGPRTGARFSANNNPVNTIRTKIGNWSQQRFNGKKADLGGYADQSVNPPRIIRILDRNTKPDICRPIQPLSNSLNSLRPLDQNLKSMLACGVHDLETTNDIVIGNSIVKQIAHRVHEN